MNTKDYRCVLRGAKTGSLPGDMFDAAGNEWLDVASADLDDTMMLVKCFGLIESCNQVFARIARRQRITSGVCCPVMKAWGMAARLKLSQAVVIHVLVRLWCRKPG